MPIKLAVQNLKSTDCTTLSSYGYEKFYHAYPALPSFYILVFPKTGEKIIVFDRLGC